jgi:hypothetical protein
LYYYPAKSETEPSGFTVLSQEYIDLPEEMVSSNFSKLVTVKAISGYIEEKISGNIGIELENFTNTILTGYTNTIITGYQEADTALRADLTGYVDEQISSKLNIETFNTLSTQIITGYQEVNKELTGMINQLAYSQIIKLPENYIATESDIISFLNANSDADKTKNILFVDVNGQTALYFAASDNATSSIVDISQEFISEASDVTAANSEKLMTVNAITGYIDDISYSKVIKLPSEYAANKSGIETYFNNNSTLDKSKDILFVDVKGQTAIWIASDNTINDISVEYINKVSSITAENSSKLMTVNAITGYVESKVSSKLETNIFSSVSGNYIEADNKLSSAVTSYVNDQVENKVELVFNDNIPTMGELGKIYISDDGAVAVVKTNNGPTTNLSLDVVSEMFTYTENDEVIPTAEAVASYVSSQLNNKQDKLTIASTVTDNNDIPNNKAVSAFVDNKLNNKIASTVANNNNIPTNAAVSAFVDSKSLKYKNSEQISFEDNTYTVVTKTLQNPIIDLSSTVKNSLCRFTWSGTSLTISYDETDNILVNADKNELCETSGTYLMSLDNGVFIWTLLDSIANE